MEFDTANKRRHAITEFRLTYNDNKKNTVSTDRSYKKNLIIRSIVIIFCFLFFTLASFLFVDSLITISEQPYSYEKKTESQTDDEIDKKYFNDIVTVPANEIQETTGTVDKE